MGKSGGRKKKGSGVSNQLSGGGGGGGAAADNTGNSNSTTIPRTNGGVDLDSPFLKTAHELREEGNTRFHNKDYVGPIPKIHPDRTGGIRTLSDLNRHSGGDDDAAQEYYTGGRKSGMLVQDPSKGNNVAAIFNQARQLGAVEGPLEPPHPSSSSSTRSFTGTGRLFSGDTVPSASQQPKAVICNIVFWSNGFTVNDGPLRRLDDPENASFLESIRKSECPKELEPADGRSSVHVNLIRRDEKCPEPEKQRHVPFQGVGRTLGSSSTSAAPEPAVVSTAVNTDNTGNSNSTTIPHANGGVDLDSPVFLKRAHELREEGNTRFHNKDYVGALEKYDNALRLIPKIHPDRAVFHSNRAACLMQMKPIDYDTVIAECTMALQVQPRFVRALLRRARAYEAIGKYELAMQDVQVLLGADPKHQDALDIACRLKTALGPRLEAQQELQSRPSHAALGASAVWGAPVAGVGPCLPARPVSKKTSAQPGGLVPLPSAKQEKPQLNVVSENGPDTKTQMPKLVLKPPSGSLKVTNPSKDDQGDQSLSSLLSLPLRRQVSEATVRWRPLKLVYDHDIRLAQMPVNCSFKVLRAIVSNRFPSSNAVLIKYKDSDGDLVTITCTAELRLAESSVDSHLTKEPDMDKSDSVVMLRLHIVEVSPEQEPTLLEDEEEEEEEEEKPLESEGTKGDESSSQSPLDESVSEVAGTGIEKADKEVQKEKTGPSEDPESREVEMDDWLFEFAQLFRTNVGIDPDAHVDLHELGMELCSEALEETVTSEEAQSLFDKAASKFQEVAALAFFNWGNVYMCAARKRIPLDESAGKEVVAAQLQAAYDWVKEKYSLAREKYEEALLIKPDFYEGLLALGQQQFEMAKLHWSFALAKKIDLSGWDSTETLKLFDSAEEKMKSATEMWEKLEEHRANEVKDPNASKKEELLRRKKQGSNVEGEPSGNRRQNEISPEETAEQAAVMRSQIHLFWGNMLFERSQVECKLGMDGWKTKLDAAVERFRLAGASEADISMVLKNHCSNGDAVGAEKKAQCPTTNTVDEAEKTEDVNRVEGK